MTTPLQQALNRLQQTLDTITLLLTDTPSTNSKTTERLDKTTKTSIQTTQSLPTQELNPLPDLNQLPEAIPQHLQTHNKDNLIKQFRATQIHNHLNTLGLLPTQNQQHYKILDSGSGENHLTQQLSKTYPTTPYDITPHTTDTITNKTTIEQNSPYNLIILYDVLDHLQQEDPINHLTWLCALLTENGQIYLRTHPWTAKHGAHLHEQAQTHNKAYLHLLLTPDEQTTLGIKPPINLKLTRPIAAYQHIFQTAGLTIKTQKIDSEPPNLPQAHLNRIIQVTWANKIDTQTATKIMTTQFIDYILTPTN